MGATIRPVLGRVANFKGFDPDARRAATLRARVAQIADEDDTSEPFRSLAAAWSAALYCGGWAVGVGGEAGIAGANVLVLCATAYVTTADIPTTSQQRPRRRGGGGGPPSIGPAE